MARLHLLPESYLFGMVDIRVFARGFSTYILGQLVPAWSVGGISRLSSTMKTTLGLLALLGLAVFAIVTGKLGKWQDRDRMRPLVYLLLAGALYLVVAMINGLNIGVRHILPLYPLAAILAGAGVAALASTLAPMDVGLRGAHCGAYCLGAERLSQIRSPMPTRPGAGLGTPTEF